MSLSGQLYWHSGVLFAATLAVSISTAPPSAAQTSEQAWERCTNHKNTVSHDAAIAACTAIIQSGRETGSDLALAHFARGRAYAEMGNLDIAIVEYNQTIKLKPDEHAAYYFRAEAFFDSGLFPAAIEDLDRSIAFRKDVPTPYFLRGAARSRLLETDRSAAMRIGAWDPIIADFSEAIRLRPNFTMAFGGRGEAYLSKGEFDKAIADFDQALRLKPDAMPVYGSRAVAHHRKGNDARAQADLGQAIRLMPSDPLNYYQRGVLHFANGRFAEAAQDFTRNIGLRKPDGIAYAYLWLYMARVRGGDGQAARELQDNLFKVQKIEWPAPVILLFLEKWTPDQLFAIAKRPDEACEARFFVGVWHALRGRPVQARPLLQEAVDTCAPSTTAYDGSRAELKRLPN